MNNWDFESGVPMNYQAKSIGAGNELAELLWRNGQVVLQSQTSRKQFANPAESSQELKQDQSSLKGTNPTGTLGNSSGLIQDDETVSWIQYPFEDHFEKEFGSNLFSEFAPTGPIEADKPIKQYEDRFVKFGAFDSTNFLISSHQQTRVIPSGVPNIPTRQMPPPKFHQSDSSQKENNFGGSGKVANFSQFSMPLRECLGSSKAHFGGEGNFVQGGSMQSSAMTIGSSHCCSNQVPNDLDLSIVSSSGICASGCAGIPVKENGGKMISLSEAKDMETVEPTLTSSSGGSGSSSRRASKQSTDVNSHKRKGKDKEESECQSQAGEPESAAGDKQTQKSKSARRSRAAEIHNLSERRRRDRINEKMRALQELIPHCNKTDKASMLDEAIEYMKSLQMQLQVMWMGGGMAPMMFPGIQHYLARMGMGICPTPLPPNAMHLQRFPLVEHSMSTGVNRNKGVPCQPPVLNPFNLQNQMQTPSFPEQYARYLNFHQMQNASQPLNMFRFGPQVLPQGQTMPLPSSSSGAFSGGTVANDSFRGKMV